MHDSYMFVSLCSHVESLNVSNFCLSLLSYASLSFLVLVSKYLSYCMRSMPFVVVCFLKLILTSFFWELSVQDTLKYPSHHLKYLLLKRKNIFMTKNSLAES